jgi:hypothetical protein
MGDVFISYKREDRPFAERLSVVLEQLGFEVWWDFDLLSGDRYRKVIRAVIDQAKVAIVLWSARAVESDFVLDEAEYAKTQGKLCPVRIDAVEPPFGFGSIHTDDLADWQGQLFHPQFQNLVRSIEARLGRQGRLGGAAHPQEAQASAAELEAFKAAQLAANPSALHAFLNRHPRGAFATFVRGQLADMEIKADAPAPDAVVAGPVDAPPRTRAAPRPPRTRATPPAAAAPPAQERRAPIESPASVDAGKPRRWRPLLASAAGVAAVVGGFLEVEHIRRVQAIPDLDARAEPFAGRWRFQNQTSCAEPESLRIEGGELIETTAGGVIFRHRIETIDASGQVTTTLGSVRQRFRLSGDTLTVTNGGTSILSRCP